jgi:capsular exopolysaccharide synthesis family protein
MDLARRPEEPNVRDYINILSRNRGIIMMFFVTTVLVVTIGSFMMTPIYRAKTTLMIDVENPNVLTSTGVVEIQSQNYYSYKEYYQSQIGIITSLPILQKVFDEFNLINTREYRNAKEPLKKFAKTISIQPVRDTRLLDLCVENRDPILASKIANRIAEIYVKRNLYYISKTELLNLMKNEYLKLEAKLSEYNKIYKEKHPEMIRLKREMEELVASIEKEKGLSVKLDYTAEEELVNNYKHALEGLKANNISILAAAVPPPVPVRPKKLFNILLSIMIGLVGGVAMAFLIEYMDDTIKEPHEIDRTGSWPFLGSVPRIDLGGKLTEFEKDIFVHVSPKDPVAETYRAIRTSIAFSTTEENPLKTIVITSPGPQEGKTTTICNLGIAMAQNQKKVLLVDADMRNPRLNDVFKRKGEVGLSTFLSGQADFGEIVQKTDIDNISLVASGIHPPNPSELLAGHRMKTFFEKAAEKFDYILVDTPPIMLLTDAAILSGIADGIILVLESGSTSKKVLPRIHNILRDAKARIMGVILNKMSLHSENYRYYSYYYSRKTK